MWQIITSSWPLVLAALAGWIVGRWERATAHKAVPPIDPYEPEL